MSPNQRKKINRQNASRSTGPRSDAGKLNSRLNALKHGLRAEAVALPFENRLEIEALMARWVEHYQPDGPAEETLVQLAARSALKIRRAAQVETAILAQQVRDSISRAHEQFADDLDRLKALFRTGPAQARRQLLDSYPGCQWAHRRWLEFQELVEHAGFLSQCDHLDQALRFLGADPDDLKSSDLDTFMFLMGNVAAAGARPAEVAYFLDPERTSADYAARYGVGLAYDREQGHRQLLSTIARELATLGSRIQQLGPEHQSLIYDAPTRALVPSDGVEARLLLRYSQSAESSFHRAYRELEARLAARADSEDEFTATGPLEVVAEAPAPNEANLVPEPTEVVAEEEVAVTIADPIPAPSGPPSPPDEPAPNWEGPAPVEEAPDSATIVGIAPFETASL